MYKRIYLIALVPGSQTKYGEFTVYFFEKEQKIVLPVSFSKYETRYLLQRSVNKLPDSQNIYDTTARIVLGLGAKILSISVYRYQNSTFYSYLNVLHHKKYLEINVKFSDGLKIAARLDAPIYIKQEILLNEGIKVTKQLLKDALRGDANLPDTY